MPFLPGGPRFGLALLNSVPATLATESVLFAIGVGMYARATRPEDGIGKHGLTGLVALLVAAYLGAAFGPPPPSVAAIAVTGIAGALVFLGLSAWVDHHRRPVSEAAA